MVPDGVTTGASNDIERATEIARNMVTKWGLSDRLGPLTYSEDDGEVFLGRSVTQHKQVSDETAHIIDEEVRKIIDSITERAEEDPQRKHRPSCTRWRKHWYEVRNHRHHPGQRHHGRPRTAAA